MVELIKSKEVDFVALRKEKSEYITEQSLEFQLNEMLLNIADSNESKKKLLKLYVARTQEKKAVEFVNVTDENGMTKTIRCSNVQITVELQ